MKMNDVVAGIGVLLLAAVQSKALEFPIEVTGYALKIELEGPYQANAVNATANRSINDAEDKLTYECDKFAGKVLKETIQTPVEGRCDSKLSVIGVFFCQTKATAICSAGG